MAILNSLTNNQTFLYEGKDFSSTSVVKMLAGSTDNGEHYIGVCWGGNDFYFYDVNKTDVLDFEHKVKSESSIGRFAASLKKSSPNAHFEVVRQEDIDGLLKKKSKVKEEEHLSLEALFNNWLSSANSHQTLSI